MARVIVILMLICWCHGGFVVLLLCQEGPDYLFVPCNGAFISKIFIFTSFDHIIMLISITQETTALQKANE
jgi:hypothetical protein